MRKFELEALKANTAGKLIKAHDLDILVAQIMKLPYGQLKKVLTKEILDLLKKYGYGEA